MKQQKAPDAEVIEWLSSHQDILKDNEGKCIAFTPEKGLLGAGKSLEAALEQARAKGEEHPWTFSVPRKDEKFYIL
jgi:hypothetical protein